MLKGSQKNWYPKIVKDIRKQLNRAWRAPDCQHYLAILVKPLDTKVREQFRTVASSMCDKVGGVRLDEAAWIELAEVEHLDIVLMRVIPVGAELAKS